MIQGCYGDVPGYRLAIEGDPQEQTRECSHCTRVFIKDEKLATPTLSRRTTAPQDVQACPACGHFFSPSINRFCLVCSAREDITKARGELQTQLSRANALYQEKERALSDVRVLQNKVNDLNVQLLRERDAVTVAHDKHTEHLADIIVRLAKGED